MVIIITHLHNQGEVNTLDKGYMDSLSPEFVRQFIVIVVRTPFCIHRSPGRSDLEDGGFPELILIAKLKLPGHPSPTNTWICEQTSPTGFQCIVLKTETSTDHTLAKFTGTNCRAVQNKGWMVWEHKDRLIPRTGMTFVLDIAIILKQDSLGHLGLLHLAEVTTLQQSTESYRIRTSNKNSCAAMLVCNRIMYHCRVFFFFFCLSAAVMASKGQKNTPVCLSPLVQQPRTIKFLQEPRKKCKKSLQLDFFETFLSMLWHLIECSSSPHDKLSPSSSAFAFSASLRSDPVKTRPWRSSQVPAKLTAPKEKYSRPKQKTRAGSKNH